MYVYDLHNVNYIGKCEAKTNDQKSQNMTDYDLLCKRLLFLLVFTNSDYNFIYTVGLENKAYIFTISVYFIFH